MGTERVSQQQINDDLVRRFITDLENIEEILRRPTPFDEIQRALIASIVPMFPRYSRIYNVIAAPPTPLIRNDSQTLMPVRIRNEDAALFLYVGQRDIIVPAGERIDPGQTTTFVLRKGQDVWGVSNAGVLQAIVSVPESAYTAAVFDGPIIM
jgi:hypothetical protein